LQPSYSARFSIAKLASTSHHADEMKSGSAIKIIQVGAVPPPFGGVSVHTQRLMARLISDGLTCEVIDISGVAKSVPNVRSLSWRRAFLHLLHCEPSIVHFHNFVPRNLYLYSLLSTRHLTVLSLHNERFDDDLRRYSPLERPIMVRLFDSAAAVVIHSETSREQAQKVGIAEQKLHVIPPFIPPATADLAKQRLPAAIEALREKHRYLLATNAYRLAFHRGDDLYGIDLVVEATGRLVNEFELDVASVILLPDAGDLEYLERLRARVAELNLTERCIFHCEPLPETAALWQRADVVVRATNTDAGDSLTVLEALASGTPAVASDCVERSSAVHLFANRDSDSLTIVCKSVLNELSLNRQKLVDLKLSDNAGKLIELYFELAGPNQLARSETGVLL